MRLYELGIVHPVQMIAGKNQQRVYAPIANMRQHLAHRVGRSLKPIRPFGSLLGSEYFDEPICKRREAVGRRNVPVERRRIELRQHEHANHI